MDSSRSTSRTPEKSYPPGCGEWYAQSKYSDTALNPPAFIFVSTSRHRSGLGSRK